MYKICHMSKKNCLYLLKSGLVPYIDTGKATHKYLIRTKDVVSYLKGREEDSEKYVIIRQYKNGKKIIGRDSLPTLREYYEQISAHLPDVMDVNVVAEFTGYCEKTVRRWCKNAPLKHIIINGKYLSPLEYLIDFMVSDYYLKIPRKCKKHRKQISTFCMENPGLRV